MTEIKVSISSSFSLIKAVSKQLHIPAVDDRIQLLGSIGEGFLKAYQLEDWLSFTISQFVPKQSISFTTINPADSGVINFIINLHSPDFSKIIDGKEVRLFNRIPKGLLYQSQGTPAQMQFRAGETYSFINVSIQLNALLRKHENEDVHWLQKPSVFLFQEFDPVLDSEVQALLNNSGLDFISSLERQSVMLTIGSRLLQKFKAAFHQTKSNWSKQDIQSLFSVRNRLSENLTDKIPTISELAFLANMSESKLKRAFKDFFGRPIFQYARYIRLLEAKRLLSTGQYNLTEVAFTIGYANLTHFGKAFKKEFGIKPNTYITRK